MYHRSDQGYPILTAQQMQMADHCTIESGTVSASELMERAGRAVADAAIRCESDGGRIVILTGGGNNGGDGLVAARLLRNSRIPVTVIPLLPVESLKGEVLKQLQLAQKAGVKIRPATGHDDLPRLENWLNRAVIVVDAIFGTGLSRDVTGWQAEVIAAINRNDCSVFSIDIPSGIDADSGEILGDAVKADFTLPIAAYKWGHWLNCGEEYSGEIVAPARIGIKNSTLNSMMEKHPSAVTRSYLIGRDAIKKAFPKRTENAHKYEFGHLWILGGSQGYSGAPRLAAAGAQAVGCGLVSIGCPDDVYPIIAALSLEVMVHPQEQAPWQSGDAMVVGPGWGRAHVDLLTKLLTSGIPTVLDADALNMLSEDAELESLLKRRDGVSVITPHPGEAGRLLGISTADVQKDRLTATLALVEKFQCWVVLKGSRTLTASPDRHLWLCSFGSPNLSVAGSGDVLAGIVGGLLAGGISAEVAVPAAVALHAIAGEQDGWHRAGELEDIVAEYVRQFRV